MGACIYYGSDWNCIHGCVCVCAVNSQLGSVVVGVLGPFAALCCWLLLACFAGLFHLHMLTTTWLSCAVPLSCVTG